MRWKLVGWERETMCKGNLSRAGMERLTRTRMTRRGKREESWKEGRRTERKGRKEGTHKGKWEVREC